MLFILLNMFASKGVHPPRDNEAFTPISYNFFFRQSRKIS